MNPKKMVVLHVFKIELENKVINYEISIKIFRKVWRNFIRTEYVSKDEEEIKKAIRKILLDYCKHFGREQENVAIEVKFNEERYLYGRIYFPIPHCGYHATTSKTSLTRVVKFDDEEIEFFQKIFLNLT